MASRLRALRDGAAGLAEPGFFGGMDLLGKGLLLLALATAARTLPGQGYGVLVTSLSAAWLISVASDLGLSPRLPNLTLTEPSDARLVWLIRYAVVGTTAGTVVVTAALGDLPAWAASVFAGVTIPLVQPGLLLAIGRTRSAALALLGPSVGWLAFLALGAGETAVACLVAFGVSNAAVGLVCSAANPELRPRRSTAWQASLIIRDSLPTAGFALTSNLYSRVDTLLLAALVSPTVAGIYGTAYRFVTTAVGLGGFVVAVSAAKLASGSLEDERRVRRQVLSLSILAVLATSVLILPATRVLTTDRLDPVTGLLLAASVGPGLLSLFFTQTALLRGARVGLLQAGLLVLLVSGLAYPLLITWSGARGAALASLLLQCLATVAFARVHARTRAGLHRGAPTEADCGPGSVATAPASPQP